MRWTSKGKVLGMGLVVGLVVLAGASPAGAAALYPPNYSFEEPVCDNGGYWPDDPGLSTGSPNWQTSGVAYFFRPDPGVVVGIGPDATAVWPQPTDGGQYLGWIGKGTTVYQLLPDQVQAGVSYVLMADAGDCRAQTNEAYHPTAVLSLCCGTNEADPSTWTTLSDNTTTLNGWGTSLALSTPAYVGAGADVGKRLGIKLTYANSGYSVNYDLTWDNVRIVGQGAETPAFSPEGGLYNSAQTVTISCATTGATIRYTTDGSDPTETNGTLIASGGTLVVDHPLTLKARAWASGVLASDIQSARYVVLLGTLYPPNYSMETPAVPSTGVNYWPENGLTPDCPDWKTSGVAWIAHIDPSVIATPSNGASAPWPPPTDGVQYLAWVGKGTTVYQLLSEQVQAGVTYVLLADAGDARAQGYEPYHPTAVLTLCAGDNETDTSGWTTLAETTVTLNGWGNVFTLSTPEYIGSGADVGRRLGVKLTFDSSSYSVNYDLTWDNVRLMCQAAATPTFSPDGGSYGGTQTVTIGCVTPGATIRYTTDGSDPTETNGTVMVSGATVLVDHSLTLKARAWASGNLPSGVKSARYIVPARTIYPPNYSFEDPPLAGGAYLDLGSASPDWKAQGYATIYKPTTGWCPATDGSQLCAWLQIGAVVYQQMAEQYVAGKSYTLKADAIDTSYSWATPHPTARLSLCACTAGDPVENWTVLSEQVQTLNGYGTAFALTAPEYVATGGVAGKRLAIKLTYDPPAEGQTSIDYDLAWDNVRVIADTTPAATPTFSPDRGYYSTAQTVTINCATPGATIRYTTDGTDPTDASLVYTGGVLVNHSLTLKARAWALTADPSAIKSALYGIGAPADWSGCVKINGQLSVPLGWFALSYMNYGQPNYYPPFNPLVLDECQQHGFACAMPYYPFGSPGNPAAMTAYLDYAQSLGVKVLIDLHQGYPGAYSPPTVAGLVNQVKDHPAVYGYYLEDEPDIRDISPETLLTLYNTVKANDPNPNHPVILNLTSVTNDPLYLQATDIVVRSVYQLSEVPATGAEAQLTREAGKSFMVNPWAGIASGYITPTAAQFKYFVFGVMAEGAGGIMPYIWETDVANPITDPATFRNPIVYPATDLLRAITPELLKGPGTLGVTATFTQGSTRIAGTANDAVLIAVNHGTAAQNAVSLTVTGLSSAVTKADVLGENRTVNVVNHAVVDNFAGQGVHVYKFLAYTTADLAAVLAAMDAVQGQPGFNVQADVNADGEVNSTDLSIVLANMQ